VYCFGQGVSSWLTLVFEMLVLSISQARSNLEQNYGNTGDFLMYVPCHPPYRLICSRGLQYKVIFAAKACSDCIASVKSFGEEHRCESGSRLAVIGVRKVSLGGSMRKRYI
jgi:hypothetical protein